jgi:hypothetical protein
VSDVVAGGAGHRDRQRADGGGLVDHHQQPAVPGEPVEQRLQLGFAGGQRPVLQPFPVGVQTDSVVGVLADVQAEEHAETAAHPPCRSLVAGGRRSGIDGRHPRYDETYPFGWPCPYQRSLDATRPGDTTPRIMRSTGGVSHAGPGDHSSLIKKPRKR